MSRHREPRAADSRRLLRARLGALFLSVAATLLLGEVAIRMVVGKPIRWRFPQETYVPDPRIGHRLRPGQDAFTHDKAVHINAYGMRDRELPLENKENVRSVLAIGDSQTFGIGLGEPDTWPRLLEKALAGRIRGIPFEVINAGVPATDTWQHELILEERFDQFRPDLVILAFYVNDVARKPNRVYPMPGMVNPGWLHRTAYVLKRSALFCALWRARIPLSRLVGQTSPEFLLEENVASGTQDEAVNRAWQQVEYSLANMNERVVRGGSRFLLVFLPRRDQISRKTSARGFVDRLTGITTKLSIELINPLEALQRAHQYAGDHLFIPWDGHNSRQANVVIAEEIASAIARRDDY